MTLAYVCCWLSHSVARSVSDDSLFCSACKSPVLLTLIVVLSDE